MIASQQLLVKKGSCFSQHNNCHESQQAQILHYIWHKQFRGSAAAAVPIKDFSVLSYKDQMEAANVCWTTDQEIPADLDENKQL